MSGESRTARALRAAAVVVAATLLALVFPVGSPLYADVYPPVENPGNVKEALTNASLRSGFDPPQVTQFETATFSATVVYGTSIDPELPTVKIAWSNEARLEATEEGTFDIEPTSLSRMFLDAGTRQPDGGYGLTWTWDVTPLLAGRHTLSLRIIPTVVIEGEPVGDVASVNKPIAVTVDVHPVKQDFDEVLAAAEDMEIEMPDTMVVGDEHDVSATLSLAGHADTVDADIELTRSGDSAAVTIVEVQAAGTSTNLVAAASDDVLVRRWTVTPDEPGQVHLVFTAKLQSEVAAHELQQDVPLPTSARATEPPPSVWQVLQQPVQYLTPFVAFAVAVLGLWAAWKRRKSNAGGDATAGVPANAKPAAKKRKSTEEGADDQRSAVTSRDPAP